MFIIQNPFHTCYLPTGQAQFIYILKNSSYIYVKYAFAFQQRMSALYIFLYYDCANKLVLFHITPRIIPVFTRTFLKSHKKSKQKNQGYLSETYKYISLLILIKRH